MTEELNKLADRLRAAALDIRRKPYPISDIIPMLNQAADALTQRPAAQAGCNHVLYETTDADRPKEICDQNGEVVLAMCKLCSKAEAELETPQPAAQATPEPVGLADLDVAARALAAIEVSTHDTMTSALARVALEKLKRPATQQATPEPVLTVEKEPYYWSGGHFHEGQRPHIDPTKVWKLPIGTKLYTHPAPGVTGAVQTLIETLKADPAYAWAWHCNVAMAAADEGLSHYAANKAAARFLSWLAQIDTTTHPNFPEAPAQPAAAVPMTPERIEQGYRSTPIVHNADPLVWFEAGVRYVEEHRHIRPNAEAK